MKQQKVDRVAPPTVCVVLEMRLTSEVCVREQLQSRNPTNHWQRLGRYHGYLVIDRPIAAPFGGDLRCDGCC